MNHFGKLRADKTFLIEGAFGDNPKLMGRLRSDARITLYLEYYYGKTSSVSSKSKTSYGKNIRKYEILKVYLYDSPKTTEQRQHNRQALQFARRLRCERDRQLAEKIYGYKLPQLSPTDMIQWMDDYYSTYTKSDHRHIQRACRIFREFLEITPLVPHFTGHLYSGQLSHSLVSAFVDYLCHRFRGEGPHTLYARFKKIIKAAVDAGVINVNPCDGNVIKIDHNVLHKDVLSDCEIAKLIETHYRNENKEVRRGFIFCLYTGLRWCDVTKLTYNNVDFSNAILRFEQTKTQGKSTASSVVIPLSNDLIALVGTPEPGQRGNLIFRLPSRRTAYAAVRRWVAAAGIDKHITWHCARHSFSLRLLNHGANIKTVASLLGHSSIRHTEKYTRAVDSLKRDAILNLPPIPHDAGL